MLNYYEVLGVDPKARLADIKKAYRRLARRHHPDLNPGDKRAEERFKKISEAYDVLSDPGKRRAYDAQSRAGGAGAGDAGFWSTAEGFDPGDLGGFSSFFSEILGGGAPPLDEDAPRRGEDLTHTITIGFFDAMRGLVTPVVLDAETACLRCSGRGTVPSRARRPCADCGGTGRISHLSGLLRVASTCRRCRGQGTLGVEGCGHCRGSGVLKQRETIRVNVPAGVDSGSRVRVPGKGRAGRNGGPPGDLFLGTQVEPHPFFARIGDNIHCTVPITVTEASLGARLDVPTIDGKATIRIPPGTESGQKFRLRGKGAPLLRGAGRGDQYVEARVVTPKAQDERTRQILRDLGALHRGDELRRGLPA
ncbi:MAG: molecular chaperone DnaJ [Candidatus Polarisedimenticolia bacterium]